jgi:uncharacterized caspase-like protein
MAVLLRWFAALLLGSTVVSAGAATGERVALVIGNSAYPKAALLNPRNDARAIGDLLRQAGFVVDQRLDTTQSQLREAVTHFGESIKDPQVKFGLFYYAGHGLQLDWRNYLVPVSAKISTLEDVRQQTVDVSELLAYMDQAKGRNFLVILDACRDDPFAGSFRPPARGLSQFDAPVGSLLAFATAPGNVAIDGDGENGLYTSNLLREFSVRGVKVEDAFKRVRLGVRIASDGLQVPWESTSLEDDLYLFPVERKKLTEEEQELLLEQELASWQRVKSTRDHLELAKFIREYPSGAVSELAQSRLNRLLAERARQAQPQKTSALPVLVASLDARSGFEMALAQPDKAAMPAAAPDTGVVIAATPYYKGYHEHVRQYHVGDVFEYRVLDAYTGAGKPLSMRVTAVDEAADRVEYNGGEYVSDTMGNTAANPRGGFSTPRQFYPAELFVGKKWHTIFKQSRPSGLVYTFSYDMKVTARETVTVPAGTFDTFKIEARGFNMQLGARIDRNIWVSPGISGDIAHEIAVHLRNGAIEQNDRQELVSFQQLGRPAGR